MSDLPKGPWIKFYPSNWLGGTRGLSAAETGVYITLIAMMYERREPIPMDERRLARLCGLPTHGFRRAVEALKDEGKIIEIDGGIWNDKVSLVIEDAQNRSSVNRENVSSRWKNNQQKQQPSDTTVIRPKQDVRSQKVEVRDTLEPNGSNADSAPPKIDPEKVMFDSGLALLAGAGLAEGRARQMLGKWRKEHGAASVIAALGAAQREGAVDPVSYITKALQFRSKKSTAPQPGDRIKRKSDGQPLEYVAGIGWTEVHE